MKQELMEHLVRYCAREVLAQIREGDESDAMGDQDQELHANADQDEQERIEKLKNKNKCGGKIRVKGKYIELDENSGETKGAPAPPADGLGTAEQPPIPKKTSGALEVDENIRKMIKRVVNEVLDTK